MKIILRISLGLVSLVLIAWLVLLVIVEPWISKKVESILNETNKNITVKVGATNIYVLNPGVEFNKIEIVSTELAESNQIVIKGEIESVKFEGIKIVKALFQKEFDIRKVTILKGNITGNIPFPEKAAPQFVSPYSIRVDNILFDKMNIELKNQQNHQFYSVRECILKLNNLKIVKQDTLTTAILTQFDFVAKKLFSVSADSMYSYKVIDISYSTSSKVLMVYNLSVHPNYKDYDFTSRYKFQTNRYEIYLRNIYMQNLNASSYLETKNILSSYIEIGNMEMKVFRDKRKEFNHIKKPTFQEMIYSYPGILNIDSVRLKKGNISFTVHAKKGNEPGIISFNEINARIFKISNDSIYKTKDDFLELKANALLMGKSKMTVLLKGKIFDNYNTFTVKGTVLNLVAKDLNPIVEKTTFVKIKSGKIDEMTFSFIANNKKSTGKLKMLYHGLSVALVNKKTNESDAFTEKFLSIIANSVILDSNPFPGENVRVGDINYKRDPEKFLFNYCFKSILSGIKPSLVAIPMK